MPAPVAQLCVAGSCKDCLPWQLRIKARTVHGPFYRKLAPEVQDADTTVKQIISGELWGKAPRFSDEAQVKAYNGTLPQGEEGFEFWAFAAPDNRYGTRVYWSKVGDFLEAADNVEILKLKIAFVKVTQSLHALAP
jgi:hypothetical protein